MHIIQIVPRLSPVVDGVGDYALCLAQEMRRSLGLKTHFVVGDVNWPKHREVDQFEVNRLSVNTSIALCSLLEKISETPALIILHYVGYGYARRGCPIWLVEGLERYRAANPTMRLVTMFHETYGSGHPYYGQDPPWTSAFWLAPLQKNLAGRLTLLSNHTITSREKFREQLKALSQGKPVQISVLPIFSSVGETRAILPLQERSRRLVLFGSRNSRARVYEQFLSALQHMCQTLEIEEIYDIGPPLDLNITQVNQIPINFTGKQSVERVAELLLEARTGVINYPPAFLGKSSMFGAYCAYGLIPVVVFAKDLSISTDGLQPGQHYWAINNSTTDTLTLESGQMIAENAYSWYQPHNISNQAQIFAKHLQVAEKVS